MIVVCTHTLMVNAVARLNSDADYLIRLDRFICVHTNGASCVVEPTGCLRGFNGR